MMSIAITMLMGIGCARLNTANDSVITVVSRRSTAAAKRATDQAIVEINKGHWESAATKLRRAIAADPTFGPAHNTLGLMHYTQENFYQSILAFEQAASLMPDHPDARFNLALSLEAAGRVDDARAIYEEIVAMYPANPNYLGNLVRLRIRMGDRGPEVQRMLRDLVVIETRPTWRCWADRLLGLELNDALDRGPPTPDFDSDTARETAEQIPLDDKIIDLSVNESELPVSSRLWPSTDSASDDQSLPPVPARALPIRPRESETPMPHSSTLELSSPQ